MAQPRGNVTKTPDKNKEAARVKSGGDKLKDDNQEPISGPSGTEVKQFPGLSNMKGLHQNQEGKDPLVNDVPTGADKIDSPVSDSFSAGTKRNIMVAGGS